MSMKEMKNVWEKAKECFFSFIKSRDLRFKVVPSAMAAEEQEKAGAYHRHLDPLLVEAEAAYISAFTTHQSFGINVHDKGHHIPDIFDFDEPFASNKLIFIEKPPPQNKQINKKEKKGYKVIEEQDVKIIYGKRCNDYKKVALRAENKMSASILSYFTQDANLDIFQLENVDTFSFQKSKIEKESKPLFYQKKERVFDSDSEQESENIKHKKEKEEVVKNKNKNPLPAYLKGVSIRTLDEQSIKFWKEKPAMYRWLHLYYQACNVFPYEFVNSKNPLCMLGHPKHLPLFLHSFENVYCPQREVPLFVRPILSNSFLHGNNKTVKMRILDEHTLLYEMTGSLQGEEEKEEKEKKMVAVFRINSIADQLWMFHSFHTLQPVHVNKKASAIHKTEKISVAPPAHIENLQKKAYLGWMPFRSYVTVSLPETLYNELWSAMVHSDLDYYFVDKTNNLNSGDVGFAVHDYSICVDPILFSQMANLSNVLPTKEQQQKLGISSSSPSSSSSKNGGGTVKLVPGSSAPSSSLRTEWHDFWHARPPNQSLAMGFTLLTDCKSFFVNIGMHLERAQSQKSKGEQKEGERDPDIFDRKWVDDEIPFDLFSHSAIQNISESLGLESLWDGTGARYRPHNAEIEKQKLSELDDLERSSKRARSESVSSFSLKKEKEEKKKKWTSMDISSSDSESLEEIESKSKNNNKSKTTAEPLLEQNEPICKIPLMPHQIRTLKWLQDFEQRVGVNDEKDPHFDLCIKKSESLFSRDAKEWQHRLNKTGIPYSTFDSLFVHQDKEDLQKEEEEEVQKLPNKLLCYHHGTESLTAPPASLCAVSGFAKDSDENIKFKTSIQESGKLARGCIVANTTGSGKSAIIVALAVNDHLKKKTFKTSFAKEEKKKEEEKEKKKEKKVENVFFSPATMIVVPKNLCSQWESEFEKFVTPERETVFLRKDGKPRKYPKPQKPRLKVIKLLDVRHLRQYSLLDYIEADVVITNSMFLENHFENFFKSEFGLLLPQNKPLETFYQPVAIEELCNMFGINILDFFNERNPSSFVQGVDDIQNADSFSRSNQNNHERIFNNRDSVVKLWMAISHAIHHHVESSLYNDNDEVIVEKTEIAKTNKTTKKRRFEDHEKEIKEEKKRKKEKEEKEEKRNQDKRAIINELLGKIKGIPPWFILWKRVVVDEIHEHMTMAARQRDNTDSLNGSRKDRYLQNRIALKDFGASPTLSLPALHFVGLSGTPGIQNFMPFYTSLAQWPFCNPRTAYMGSLQMAINNEWSEYHYNSWETFIPQGLCKANLFTLSLESFKEKEEEEKELLIEAHGAGKNFSRVAQRWVLENCMIRSGEFDVGVTLSESVIRFDITPAERAIIESKKREADADMRATKELELLCYFNAENAVGDNDANGFQLMGIDDMMEKIQGDRVKKLQDLSDGITHAKINWDEKIDRRRRIEREGQPPSALLAADGVIERAEEKYREAIQKYEKLKAEHGYFKTQIKLLGHAQDESISEENQQKEPREEKEEEEKEEKEENDEGICTICMCNALDMILPCGHLYCKGCIMPWVEINMNCPMCKVAVMTKDAIKIAKSRPSMYKKRKNDKDAHVKWEKIYFPPMDDIKKFGSKLARVVALIRQIKEKGEKVVVFSQWTSISRALAHMLETSDISCADISRYNTHTRNAILKNFCGSDPVVATEKPKNKEEEKEKGPKEEEKKQEGEKKEEEKEKENKNLDAVLLSIEDSTAGMNLWKANHCIFMHGLLPLGAERPPLSFPDSPMNPVAVTQEAVGAAQRWKNQAVARIWRMGQVKPCHVYWFLANDSIET